MVLDAVSHRELEGLRKLLSHVDPGHDPWTGLGGGRARGSIATTGRLLRRQRAQGGPCGEKGLRLGRRQRLPAVRRQQSSGRCIRQRRAPLRTSHWRALTSAASLRRRSRREITGADPFRRTDPSLRRRSGAHRPDTRFRHHQTARLSAPPMRLQLRRSAEQRRGTSRHLVKIDRKLPQALCDGAEPANQRLLCFAHHRHRHEGHASPRERWPIE